MMKNLSRVIYKICITTCLAIFLLDRNGEFSNSSAYSYLIIFLVGVCISSAFIEFMEDK